MESKIKKALASSKADYIEIRIQEGVGTGIAYAGKELEDIGESTFLGGSVRALWKGAWGFCSFNDIEHLPRYVKMACEQAQLVGKEKSQFASVPPRKDEVKTIVAIDPSTIPLVEKQRLCEKYNNVILANKKIQTSSVRYRDSVSVTTFANTDGAYLVQEVKFCGIGVMAIAKDGMNVQRAHHSVGDLRGYGNVLNFEHRCEEVAKRAIDLLSAEPVKAGRYTVIVDPLLAGVFAHEAFGHLSEADHVYENEKLREIMTLGKRFGGDHLAIVDDGTLPGEAGTMAYDGEGTPTQKTYLIKGGILTARLHSRETAAKMGEQPTGNARTISYSHEPIVRMTNTYIEPRDWTFERMLSETQEGIYAIGALGGMTDTEMFTFSAEEAYEIKGGKLGKKLRDVVLTGNVFETLANIDAIGSDLKLFGGLGGCGKGGQSPLRVSCGSPHLRIRNVVIGGK
jgi:TldD protein